MSTKACLLVSRIARANFAQFSGWCPLYELFVAINQKKVWGTSAAFYFLIKWVVAGIAFFLFVIFASLGDPALVGLLNWCEIHAEEKF